MSQETLVSRAWSCQSLANGAGAAVAVAGMPLQKFNREEIQKRMKDSEFWVVPTHFHVMWFTHIPCNLRYCNSPPSLLQEAQQKLLALKACKKEPAPETQLNCINSLLWFIYIPQSQPAEKYIFEEARNLDAELSEAATQAADPWLAKHSCVYRSFNHIEWCLSRNLWFYTNPSFQTLHTCTRNQVRLQLPWLEPHQRFQPVLRCRRCKSDNYKNWYKFHNGFIECEYICIGPLH